MMSGMRKPSPISISSPRETMTSPPAASSLSARKMAAALLLTAIAGAPEQAFEQRARGVTSRLPRRPVGEIVFEIGVARAANDERPSGARPRLVCSTTPVALMTRRKRRPFERCERRARRAPRWRSPPARRRGSRRRAASMARRISATTSARGNRARRRRKLFEHLVNGGKIAELLRDRLTNSMVRGRVVCQSGATELH